MDTDPDQTWDNPGGHCSWVYHPKKYFRGCYPHVGCVPKHQETTALGPMSHDIACEVCLCHTCAAAVFAYAGRCGPHGDSAWAICFRKFGLLFRTASYLQNSFNLRHAKAGLATCTIYYLILNTSWYFMYYKRDWMHIWYKVVPSRMWPIFYKQDPTTLRSPATFQCSLILQHNKDMQQSI